MARVGLAGAAFAPSLELRLEGSRADSLPMIAAAIEKAPKPVRIVGEVRGSVLWLGIGSTTDPGVVTRFQASRHNLQIDPPLVAEDAPDDVEILVVAFDQLLRVPKAGWRTCMTDYWVDGSAGWAADYPDSEWATGLCLPPDARNVAAIVLLGYTRANEWHAPFAPDAWGKRPT